MYHHQHPLQAQQQQQQQQQQHQQQQPQQPQQQQQHDWNNVGHAPPPKLQDPVTEGIRENARRTMESALTNMLPGKQDQVPALVIRLEGETFAKHGNQQNEYRLKIAQRLHIIKHRVQTNAANQQQQQQAQSGAPGVVHQPPKQQQQQQQQQLQGNVMGASGPPQQQQQQPMGQAAVYSQQQQQPALLPPSHQMDTMQQQQQRQQMYHTQQASQQQQQQQQRMMPPSGQLQQPQAPPPPAQQQQQDLQLAPSMGPGDDFNDFLVDMVLVPSTQPPQPQPQQASQVAAPAVDKARLPPQQPQYIKQQPQQQPPQLPPTQQQQQLYPAMHQQGTTQPYSAPQPQQYGVPPQQQQQQYGAANPAKAHVQPPFQPAAVYPPAFQPGMPMHALAGMPAASQQQPPHPVPPVLSATPPPHLQQQQQQQQQQQRPVAPAGAGGGAAAARSTAAMASQSTTPGPGQQIDGGGANANTLVDFYWKRHAELAASHMTILRWMAMMYQNRISKDGAADPKIQNAVVQTKQVLALLTKTRETSTITDYQHAIRELEDYHKRLLMPISDPNCTTRIHFESWRKREAAAAAAAAGGAAGVGSEAVSASTAAAGTAATAGGSAAAAAAAPVSALGGGAAGRYAASGGVAPFSDAQRRLLTLLSTVGDSAAAGTPSALSTSIVTTPGGGRPPAAAALKRPLDDGEGAGLTAPELPPLPGNLVQEVVQGVAQWRAAQGGAGPESDNAPKLATAATAATGPLVVAPPAVPPARHGGTCRVEGVEYATIAVPATHSAGGDADPMDLVSPAGLGQDGGGDGGGGGGGSSDDGAEPAKRRKRCSSSAVLELLVPLQRRLEGTPVTITLLPRRGADDDRRHRQHYQQHLHYPSSGRQQVNDTGFERSGGGEWEEMLLAAVATGSADGAEVVQCCVADSEASSEVQGRADGCVSWRRLRLEVPDTFPAAAALPTFDSSDEAYQHPHGVTARTHFQVALEQRGEHCTRDLSAIVDLWHAAVAAVDNAKAGVTAGGTAAAAATAAAAGVSTPGLLAQGSYQTTSAGVRRADASPMTLVC